MKRSMQEPSFLILTVLAAGAQHGYAIMNEVVEISAEQVRLRPGSLYAALDRLRDEGLVAVDREEIVDTRLRRYYKITDSGAQRLAAEVTRMRHNADSAARRLAVGGFAQRLAGGTP